MSRPINGDWWLSRRARELTLRRASVSTKLLADCFVVLFDTAASLFGWGEMNLGRKTDGRRLDFKNLGLTSGKPKVVSFSVSNLR